MAAMQEVDSAPATPRFVFLSSAIISLASAGFLLFGTLLTTTSNGIDITLSTTQMLVDGGVGGLVLLLFSLAMLWPAYMSFMAAVGMWQRRERLLWAGYLSLSILAVLMISSWRWIADADAAGDTWVIGNALIGFTICQVALIGHWRAGLWLLDSPYRD